MRVEMTEAERESLIEAIQAGYETAWVESIIAARIAEALRGAAAMGRERGFDDDGRTCLMVESRWLRNLADEYAQQAAS
jgi:hypothetical protein